jgi:ADP-ribose pyrophosphatase YjhB (NUDIX family)
MTDKRAGMFRRTVHWGFMLRRALTLGVRGIVEDGEGRILFVRHTYVKGWHFPGGGVEPHETAAEALKREIFEEASIELMAAPVLAGAYFNRRLNGRDHVLLFRCSQWRAAGAFKPGAEIAEARFFGPDELPEDLSLGTRRRINELYRGEQVSAEW